MRKEIIINSINLLTVDIVYKIFKEVHMKVGF